MIILTTHARTLPPRQLEAVAARQGRGAQTAGKAKKKASKPPRVVKRTVASKHPLEFVCGIMHELMADPVIAMDGQSYERKAIENWFARLEAKGLPITSPITGERVELVCVPNRALKSMISTYCSEQGIPVPQPPP